MSIYSYGYLGAPGATVPILIEPILLEMEGGRYVGVILPGLLAEAEEVAAEVVE